MLKPLVTGHRVTSNICSPTGKSLLTEIGNIIKGSFDLYAKTDEISGTACFAKPADGEKVSVE